MSATYFGTTDSLIKLPEDSLAIQPSKLAILVRKYACAISYVQTARSVLVPNHVPEGYPNLKLFTAPVENTAAGITTFVCTYYGYINESDLENPFIKYNSIIGTAGYLMQNVNGNYETISFPVICPVVSVSYITIADYPKQITNLPALDINAFVFEPQYNVNLTDSPWSRAQVGHILSSYQSNRYIGVTEVIATYNYVAYGADVVSPMMVLDSDINPGNLSIFSSTVLPNFVRGGAQATYSVTGAALLTSENVNGITVYTITPNDQSDLDQDFVIHVSYPGNIPSGYNYTRDYDPSNPQYYFPASADFSYNIPALPPITPS